MNPRFCPQFHMRPKFVPVVVRPTVPVSYGAYDPPSPQYNIPLFPIHLTPDANDAMFSPTTSRTRRDLEQLGSPTEDLTKMIFELAAQKNGIRIGTDHYKVGTAIKQSHSLEDFKKIAERNGITVCPADSACGSETCLGSEVTPSSTTMPQLGLSRSSSSAVNDDVNNSCSEKCTAEAQNVCGGQENVSLFEAEVEMEMNSKLSAVDLIKNKAARSGIRIQDTSESVQIQTGESGTLAGDYVAMAKQAEGGLSGENQVYKSDTATGKAVASADNTRKSVHALGSNTPSNADTVSESEPKIESLKMETSESRMTEMTSKHDSQVLLDVKKGVENYGIDKGCASITTSTTCSVLTTEHVSTVTSSLVEDAQIKAFQEIARLKGIKVGDLPNETGSASNFTGQVPGHSQPENLAEAIDLTEQDAQIARFQEMARMNGIKVGEGNTRKFSGETCSKQFESLMAENAQDREYYTDLYTYPFEQDPQIAMFQEIARLKGIKVSKSRSSSYSSSISPANSEDHLCPPGEVINPMVMHYSDSKGDVFEELAKRNGIKVGKSDVHVVPSLTPVVNNTAVNDCGTRPIFSTVSSHVGTQTEVTVVVDCFSQTSEEDHSILKRATGVQVSPSKEAFEEEYLLWKLDENASGDSEELCYKELHLDEKKMREELSASLQDEKDMSASARHNHKRVMDQLKEELSGKSEEVEKLKKDLKTLKKHKETEIKRISKELKSKEEELEANKTTLHLKEAALEGMRTIAHEQTAKLKALEEQLEEMKTALSEVSKNDDCTDCKTCLTRSTETKAETTIKESSQEEQSGDDGWTVFTGKKSKSPSHKPAQNKKAQGLQQHGGVDQLFDIDLTHPPPCLYLQSVGERSVTTNKQDSSLDGITCDAGCSPLMVDDKVKGGAKSSISVASIQRDDITEPMQEFPSVLPKSGQNPPLLPQNHQQNVLANSNPQKPPVATVACGPHPPQVFVPPTFTGQACSFPAVPPELLSQYFSSLQMLQKGFPPGNGLPQNTAPLRRPPGLNTEPVPEGEVPEQSPPPPAPSTGKFSSFDKLMEALQKRFPSKNRQELIIYLKKAKAASGSAGFRGKQIPDVVKCVEDMVELEERQESQDRKE